MRPPLPSELVEKIRDEVRKGRIKRDVAKELGVSCSSVIKYTSDMPSRRSYTDEEKKKIRRMVRETGKKLDVARRLGVPYKTVEKIAWDIRVGSVISFGRKTMDVLSELFGKGYVYMNGEKTAKIYMLRKYFPFIEIARIKTGKAIAFLPERKEEAMRALLERFNKKVWTYQELRRVTKLFDSDLRREEKHKLVKENRKRGKERDYSRIV